MSFVSSRNAIGIASILMVLVGWLAYAPGLGGGFLFDDYVNLDALGRSGAVDDWPTFWRYLTSGTADPTGRPIALLSFLIDARDWPADPLPFLRTNVLLHLLNGLLLFALLRELEKLLGAEGRYTFFPALLASSFWLLHPLFVSTTLYAVQREAMLPATFVLLGLIAYCQGRSKYVATDGAAGAGLMAMGICVGTLLATLSKANGILLPLLAGVLEYTVLAAPSNQPKSQTSLKRLSQLKMGLLILPSVLILLYLSQFVLSWSAPLANRPWTIGQRILTEPRIVLDYLQLLVIPRSVSSGLFNDHYTISTGLFQPLSTAPALLAVIGLIFLANWFRIRSPSFAAALLFYFAGHVLESSAVPLELYFEHRNYLPAMLFFWPLARVVCAYPVAFHIRALVGGGLIAFLVATTYQRAELWGNPDRLAALWASSNPSSTRAQANAGLNLINAGQPGRAVNLLRPRYMAQPGDAQLAATFFVARCALPGGLSLGDKQAFATSVRESRFDQELVYRWLDSAAAAAATGQCRGLSLEDVARWLDETVKQDSPGAFRSNHRESLLGNIALYRQDPNTALAHYDRNLDLTLKPEVAASQAARLAAQGHFDHALAHLAKYERVKDTISKPRFGMPWIHAWLLRRQGYWPNEMDWLKSNFIEAAAGRTEESQKVPKNAERREHPDAPH